MQTYKRQNNTTYSLPYRNEHSASRIQYLLLFVFYILLEEICNIFFKKNSKLSIKTITTNILLSFLTSQTKERCQLRSLADLEFASFNFSGIEFFTVLVCCLCWLYLLSLLLLQTCYSFLSSI